MSVNDSRLLEDHQKKMEILVFGWLDYSFFITMLCVSTIIGIYFGFIRKKQNNTTEYLLGGKTMGCFPVAMSITASHVSGITLLGIPAEVYRYGTQYAACIFTTILTCLATAYIFLPVFHKLQLTSTFEYLELRFARSIRQFASVLCTISLILHTPIVLYGPALAFAQVTSFHFYYVAPVIGLICIFYTCVGGLKAVVWTDTIQFTVTIFTLFTVFIIGVISIGGFSEIWRISSEGDRLVFFDMNPSPFVRTSFWAMSIGMTTSWMSQISVNQGCMQRFLAVSTITEAKKAILMTCCGLILVKYSSVYTGLIIYSKYHGCDPIKTGAIHSPDQLLPYYVLDVTRGIPGLPGLFLAALVSSALSSMSGGLNTAAGTIWEDFISPYVRESDTKEQTATKVMKLIVIVLGILCIFLVFGVDHLGSIFSISSSMHGVTAGTMIGIYTLGVLVPWANYKGAMIGGIMSFVTSTWLIVGAQYHKLKKSISYEPLPTSIDNCSFPLDTTNLIKPNSPPIEPDDEPMILYTVSFLYYSLIGALIVIICGTIVSFLTGASDLKELNRDHFTPFVQRFLPEEKYVAVPLKTMSKKGADKEMAT